MDLTGLVDDAARRVLVIDDDPHIVRLIQRLLIRDSARWEIDGASGASDGIDLVRKARAQGRPYSVAWVDLFLEPGFDGLVTTQGIWRVDPEIEIVLCTGLPEATSSREISEHCAMSPDQIVILCKPFEGIEVRQITQALAEKWELRQRASGHMYELERRVAGRTAELEGMLDCLRGEAQAREKVEVELRHAQKLEAVGQLAAGIAHEINTPVQFVGDSVYFLREAFSDLMRLVDGYRELLQGRDLTAEVSRLESAADLAFIREEVAPAFERTFEGIRRVGRIVGAMKEFAHPGGDDPVDVDLNRVVDNTLTVARNEYKYVADLEVDLGELPAVRCHPDDLGQVVLNLVVNAAHAIGEVLQERDRKGRISIRTLQSDPTHVRLSVTDDGPGIPEAIVDRIFDPFFTTKEVGKGTGQGLALAHSIIVERHGGAISVDTEVGRGSTFHIDLPIAGIAAGAS